MFYFEQGFVFCRLINENILEGFLLMFKEHTRAHLQTLYVEAIPHYVFD